MRSSLLLAAATAVLVVALAGAMGAVAAPARFAGATPAAAPFAEAWANVPASAVVRRARQIAVFGTSSSNIPGFNGYLNCCIRGVEFSAGLDEATRGAFRQDSRGVWVKDLVTEASADAKGVSYTISPKAFWYWGGRKVPVTYRDFVYTLQQIDDPNNDIGGNRAGYSSLDPAQFTHKGARQVRFLWRTTDCSADFPCGPFAAWQSLFSGEPALYPSFALTGLDFNKIWTSCICGSDGKPVSDGPFYLAAYTPGQGTTLRANPYWGGKTPSLAEIDVRFFTDFTIETQAMRLGDIDAMEGRVSPDLVSLKSVLGMSPGPGSALTRAVENWHWRS